MYALWNVFVASCLLPDVANGREMKDVIQAKHEVRREYMLAKQTTSLAWSNISRMLQYSAQWALNTCGRWVSYFSLEKLDLLQCL